MAAAPEKNNANKAEHEGGGAKKTYLPYDLNASDNPGNIITQVQLRGENYDEWARAVKISLRARRKWGFIDGTHIQPEDEAPDLEDWWTVQSMIISWILNTIEPSLRSTVAYAETAHNFWEDIKERFSACGIGAQLEKRREEEKVHQLLMGLDDASYETVRSNILASNPLSSLNRVYAMLVQEEKVRMMAKSTEERGLVVGLAMQANYKEKGRGDVVEKSMTCSHCGKNGHDMKGCFQLIGYPEWWGDRPKSEGKWNGRGRQGMRNKGNPARANVAHASGSNSQANNDDKKLEMAGLTNEQWKVLVDMISKQKSNE
ncbi:uncharacterized protein [Phaseolus vulgaris]|uniref:uncharacterized protein n=1 Tax=Phaseolus vulgaris TaxID=3885 RepID=UPI0035C95877